MFKGEHRHAWRSLSSGQRQSRSPGTAGLTQHLAAQCPFPSPTPGPALGNLVLPWGPTPSQLSSTGSSGTWPHSPPAPGAST